MAGAYRTDNKLSISYQNYPKPLQTPPNNNRNSKDKKVSSTRSTANSNSKFVKDPFSTFSKNFAKVTPKTSSKSLVNRYLVGKDSKESERAYNTFDKNEPVTIAQPIETLEEDVKVPTEHPVTVPITLRSD